MGISMAEAVTIARPYAVAAFRLAKEKKVLAAWSDMLSFISAVVADDRLQAYIGDPKIKSSDLEQMMLSICENKLDASGENLVRLLVENGRLPIVPDIVAAFEELKAADDGVLEAEITAATALTDVETSVLVKKLEAKFGKKIEASVKVDPEIIGGIKILVGDTVIDASVKGQLQQLAYTLKG
jgi:F-type H+-transporting ATPase subunit delta